MRAASGAWVVLACLSAPAPAWACGGFFCGATQPVVQSGEQIVYAIEDDGSLVMSVRINYQGTAPDFAWLLPVPVVPAIELGTTAFFDTLERSTVPQFTAISRVEGACAPAPSCPYADTFVFSADAGSAVDGSAPPTIYLEENLGPYEIVVIGGTTGGDVYAWLSAHGYALPPSATPLLDAYLALHDVFVALRLRTDASTSEIQPITLRMVATQACLPIRLTSIATSPDLPITAFFLATGRVVSSNFSMLDATWDEPGLYTHSVSYASWVTRAVLAQGGHAFATDYAGTTPTISITLPSVLDLASERDPHTLLLALSSRGYRGDPQLLALLTRFVVPPAGSTPRAYFNCLFGAFGSCGTPTTYDPAGLVAAIDQTITQPRAHAQRLAASRPYTTRLFTTMSADAMTLDPEFRVDALLSPVTNVHAATFVAMCDSAHWDFEAATRVEFPDGTSTTLPVQPHGTIDDYCLHRYGIGTGRDAGAVEVPGVFDVMLPDGGPRSTPVPASGCGCTLGSARGSYAPMLAALIALARMRRRARRALLR